MATLLAKTYTIPVITAHRMNCQGDVYTVRTSEYTDTVIVGSTGHSTCTCHDGHCEHIRAVERSREQDATKAASRESYCSTFNIY